MTLYSDLFFLLKKTFVVLFYMEYLKKKTLLELGEMNLNKQYWGYFQHACPVVPYSSLM